MDKPKVAGTVPIKVSCEANKPYAWCACGLSENQPYCDGSHMGTAFNPVMFTEEESKEVWLCACKTTNGQPYCDGSHNNL